MYVQWGVEPPNPLLRTPLQKSPLSQYE